MYCATLGFYDPPGTCPGGALLRDVTSTDLSRTETCRGQAGQSWPFEQIVYGWERHLGKIATQMDQIAQGRADPKLTVVRADATTTGSPPASSRFLWFLLPFAPGTGLVCRVTKIGAAGTGGVSSTVTSGARLTAATSPRRPFTSSGCAIRAIGRPAAQLEAFAPRSRIEDGWARREEIDGKLRPAARRG